MFFGNHLKVEMKGSFCTRKKHSFEATTSLQPVRRWRNAIAKKFGRVLLRYFFGPQGKVGFMRDLQCIYIYIYIGSSLLFCFLQKRNALQLITNVVSLPRLLRFGMSQCVLVCRDDQSPLSKKMELVIFKKISHSSRSKTQVSAALTFWRQMPFATSLFE